MAFPTNSFIRLAIFIIFFTGFGSGLRVVTQPQPFNFFTKELNISCVADEPAYISKSIISVQIMRHAGDKPIAVVNMRHELKMAVGVKDNVKAEGHIGVKSNTSYLTLIIDKPDRQDAGPYRCQMFYMDKDFQMVEKNVIGNVTYQESDITWVVTHLTGQVSSLLTNAVTQNQTIQTLTQQHITFNNIHSKHKLDMDILTDKIKTQNDTNIQQNKQLDELRDYNSREKQDMDILTDELDRQKNTDTKLTEQFEKQNQTIQTQIKQHTSFKDFHSLQKLDMDILTDKIDTQNNTIIEQNKQLEELKDHQSRQKQDIDRQNQQIDELKNDNTKKQHQIDILTDNIKHQNKTIHEMMGLLQPQIKKKVCLDKGWMYYDGDQTCLKAFGKDDSSQQLSWPKGRESCQALGGDLVIVRDEDKSNFVVKMFDGFSGNSPWIGVKNHGSRGFDYKYVDGSDIGSYHPWGSGDPSNYGYKCVFMSKESSTPGEWYNQDCSNAYTYVCST